jgi:hypothetical protein
VVAAARSAPATPGTLGKEVANLISDATSISSARDQRWLILGVTGLAQLTVILDPTVMGLALAHGGVTMAPAEASREGIR